jgi:hypothetical protein
MGLCGLVEVVTGRGILLALLILFILEFCGNCRPRRRRSAELFLLSVSRSNIPKFNLTRSAHAEHRVTLTYVAGTTP